MNNPQKLKFKITHAIVGNMLKKQIDVSEIAVNTRLSKKRIGALLNPTDTVLDLEALCKVCDFLGIRVRVNNKVLNNPEKAISGAKIKRAREVTPRVLGSRPHLHSRH